MPVAVEQPPPMLAIQAPAHRPTAAPITHLSWSSLQDYSMCPRKFFFRRVACVAEERRSSSLVFGGSIHRAVELAHEARIAGGKLPSPKSLLAAYEGAWRGELSQGPEVVYPKGDTQDSLRDTASRMLMAYRKHYKHDRGKVIAIEHEATLSLTPESIPLKARIDLVTVEGQNLIVSDLKTSKSRWSDSKVAESLPQLVIYSAATTGLARELGLRRIVPRFVILTKAKEPVIQTIDPQASQADVVRLRELVSETARAIRSEVFPRREGWQCAQCPYSGRCLGNGRGQ